MGKKRGFRRYLKGRITVLGDLSALAAKDAIAFTPDGTPAVNERTYVSSMKATYTLSNLTDAFSDGPIIVGIAHGDYDAGEIEVWLENAGSWNEGNLVAQEIAKRKIRQVGVFDTPAQALGKISFNYGKPVTTKCGWVLLQGQDLKVWCYNAGSSALATTAPELAVEGHVNLWPR